MKITYIHHSSFAVELEQADAKKIFPMHFWEDYSIIKQLNTHPSTEKWRDKIVEITEEGEVFAHG